MRSLFFLSFLLVCFEAQCQQTAVTDKGDIVYLYPDGTWKFSIASENTIDKKVDTNATMFKTPSSSKFLVKSSRTGFGVSLNSNKWTFKKSEGNGASEMSFQLKDKDAYALLITERVELPMKTLKKAALDNARKVAPDARIVKEEYRNVNGNTVLMMRMEGTIEGIGFIYLGYYFSYEKGTVQLITYTFNKLIEENEEDLENFLNGFQVLN